MHAEDSPDRMALLGIGCRINTNVSLDRLRRNKWAGSPACKLDMCCRFVLSLGKLRFFHDGSGEPKVHSRHALFQPVNWQSTHMFPVIDRLASSSGKFSFVELVVLTNVDVANVLLLLRIVEGKRPTRRGRNPL
jgi:hypothetical protein